VSELLWKPFFPIAAIMLPANVSLTRRNAGPIVLFAVLILSTIYYRAIIFGNGSSRVTVPVTTHDEHKNPAAFNWARVTPRYPVTSYIPLPSPPVRALPRLQHTPSKQTGEPARVRQERLQAVKAEFVHAWDGYRYGNIRECYPTNCIDVEIESMPGCRTRSGH